MRTKSMTFLSGLKARTAGMRWLLMFCVCLASMAAKAQVTLILGSGNICVGTTSSLSDLVPGGTWSSSNTAVGTIGVTTGLVTGIAAGTTRISYQIDTKLMTRIITVDPLPAAGVITGGSITCAGATIALSDAATGGTWSSGAPGVATVGVTGIVTGTVAGTASISYTVTNSCGSVVATHIVTISPVPGAGLITGTGTVCVGAIASLSDLTTGGSWSSSNSVIATVSSTGMVTGVAVGTAIISYTVSNSCGTATASRVVTVNPLPNAGTISGTASVCAGHTTSLSDAIAGGVWSSGSPGIAAVGVTGIVTGASAGTASISYTVTNSCGSAVATRIVTINPAPAAGTITGVGTVCAGATTSLTDLTAAGTWSSSNSLIATIGGTGIVTGVAAGTAIISYSVTNSCGTATASRVVTVNPMPNAGTISGTASVCAGHTTSLSDAGGASGGVWSSGSPSIATVGILGVATGVSAGTTIITYTVTNVCGSAAATRVVTVNPLPAAGSITGAALVCAGATISLTDAATGGVWHSSAASVAAVGSTGIVTGMAAGTTTISYTVTNGCGSATATKVVTVSTTTVGPITGPSTVVAPATITLTDATAGGTWSASNTHATVAGGVVTGVSAGSVIISYTVTGPCGTAVATKVVNVTVPTVPPITGYVFDMCAGDSRPFFESMPGGIWSISPVSVATVSATGVVTGISAGTATLSYTVGAVYATAIVTIYAVPAPITGNGVLCVGDTTTLYDATPGGTWSSGLPSKASVTSTGFVTALNHSHIAPPIYYTIGSHGCRAVFILTVNFPPLGIYGPNKVCEGATVTLHDDSTAGTWSGSNALAAVDGSGNVTGLAAGVTHITYTLTSDGCYKALQMTVNPMPAPIAGTLKVCEGHVTFVSDATMPGVSWTSSTPAVASASYSGAISGVSAGTATISYMAATTCVRAAVVTVNPTPVVTPILGPSFVSHSGPGITLSDLTPGGLWSSGNTAILTVGSSTGLVIAHVSAGFTSISYTVTNSSGCSAVVSKMISTSPAPPGHRGTTTTSPGSTITFAEEAMGGEWQSSDNAIATVDRYGVVSAVAPGVVTISHTVANDDGSLSTNTHSVIVSAFLLDVTVLPNPNRGTFTVRGTTGLSSEETVTLEITDMTGHLIYTAGVMAPGGIINEQIVTNGLASGMYLLKVSGEGGAKVFRFIIE